MPLTELQLRSAKPRDRAYKVFDTGGLFVVVTPSGGKLWRMRFKVDGKEKLLALGAYPAIGLAEARRRRNQARERLDEGHDPASGKQRAKAAAGVKRASTFKRVALEWHELRRHEWTASYAAQVLSRLEEDIFPLLGEQPIADIKPRDVLDVLDALKRVEARGVLETTRRLRQYCSSIFRYAIAAGVCEHDPASPLKGALKAPPRPRHHKALARHEVADFLARLRAYDGEPQTRIAIKLALLTVVRTTELRAARWSEFEGWEKAPGGALWRIPEERMTTAEPHIVPLSRQACTAPQDLHQLTGKKAHLFPSVGREGYMSNNTMLYGLYRMGFHGRTTTHGFRRLFSTEAQTGEIKYANPSADFTFVRIWNTSKTPAQSAWVHWYVDPSTLQVHD